MPALRLLLLCVATFFLPAQAFAADGGYPNRPIRLIIPQATGGGSDTIGRYMAQRLGEALGQNFVVDNRPGAAGMLGAEMVKQATPDGYTLLLCAIDTITAPIVAQHKTLDGVRDFAPITQLAQSPNIWLVGLSFPAKTMKEFVAAAKARPGQIDYASSGIGSMQHLGAELLNKMAGIQLNHVPYKGGPPGLVDVMGGRMPSILSGTQGALPHIKAGKIRPLSVTTATRLPALPDIPTAAEALGIKDYEATNWQGFLFPAGTPKAIAERVSAAAVVILKTPETRKRLEELGYIPSGMTPAQMATMMAAEKKRWTVLIKEAGIKAE
ncbi:MAG: tripartite tricarboxylate transporter substrate binding protein [Burkholderiales bacterium]|nr:tripartite tricarboxylate transporter substrate binding protein [Burkholderiales bacterium]